MKCYGCNTEIIKKSPNQRWCLRCAYDQCKDTSHKAFPEIECSLCKKSFIPTNAQQINCSKECIRKHKTDKANSRWSNSKPKKPKMIFGYKELMIV